MGIVYDSTSVPGTYPMTFATKAVEDSSQVGPAPDQPPWNDPQYWYRPDWSLIKPDLSAPGYNIRSSVPGGGYTVMSGHNFSCPHLTGGIAIIFQKNSDLSLDSVYFVLTEYADSIGDDTLPNHIYGWGHLNVYQALVHTPFGIKESTSQSAQSYLFLNVYPNPFRTSVTFKFQSATQYGGQNKNTLKIFDVTGRLVKSFSLSTPFDLRPSHITWDGRDNPGNKLPSGVYFVELTTKNFSHTEKVVLLE